jgi:hypothetical protein
VNRYDALREKFVALHGHRRAARAESMALVMSVAEVWRAAGARCERLQRVFERAVEECSHLACSTCSRDVIRCECPDGETRPPRHKVYDPWSSEVWSCMQRLAGARLDELRWSRTFVEVVEAFALREAEPMAAERRSAWRGGW